MDSENEIVSRRAIRRHHYERLKNKWRKQLLENEQTKNAKDGGEIASRRVTTPTPCSCYMCGNPRHHFGARTLKERKEERNFMEQVKETFEEVNHTCL